MDNSGLPLRGYRSVMEDKYATKSGHACTLARRYLRFIRWTNDYGLPDHLYKRLIARFGTRIGWLAINDVICGPWVNGRRVHDLSAEQRKSIEHIQSLMSKLTT